jgi:hypothetical protein
MQLRFLAASGVPRSHQCGHERPDLSIWFDREGLGGLAIPPASRARSAVQGSYDELHPSLNERFGFGVSGSASGYDVGQLHAGWYVDWGARMDPPHPAGLEHVQMVRLHQLTECWPQRTRDRSACPYVRPYTYTLTSPGGLTEVASFARSNPGSLWLIGNEMDRRDWDAGGQDEMLPELYAHAYHELYHLIKNADPTALVAIGGVVQPTPLRLE